MNQHDPLFDRDAQKRRQEAHEQALDALYARLDDLWHQRAPEQEIMRLMEQINALQGVQP